MRIALLESADPQRPPQVFMPMGLAYLKGWLERRGQHRVLIARTASEALAWKPQVIGISAVSPNFPYAIALARSLRQQTDVPLLLGGAHISSLPHSLPQEFLAGILGEGEYTLEELVELLDRCPHPSPSQLGDIKGLAYHSTAADLSSNSQSEVLLSPPRPLIADLDELALPQRSWLDDSPGLAPTLWSFSSRGCPYRCTFCATARFWERYRLHSPQYVVNELKQIVTKYNPPMHIFMDDLFAANHQRVADIAALARKELPRSLPLSCTVRADLVNEKICLALKDLGVSFCHLGLESASDSVLSYLKNKTTTAKINQDALDMLSRHGIKAVGSFIIGAPNEQDEDIAATWQFIDSNLQSGKMQSFSFGPLVAFPGTKVWDDACCQGLIDPQSIDWRLLDIDLRAFDLNRYILLSPLTRERFGYWFQRFYQRWQQQFKH